MPELIHSSVCINCGSELIQNPLVSHWRHCPKCEPEHVAFIHATHDFATFMENRHHARSRRGAPAPRRMDS